MKRLIIATLLGLVFGGVCFGFASGGGNEIAPVLAANIILGRTLIGFAIGISRFSMKHWAIHGLVMGLLFSLPAGFGVMLGPGNPEFSPNMMFISTVVMGMIYGFLIELITSVVFKARIK
jgi:hypothetical protein